MAKKLQVENREEDTREPFLRGILVYSLQSAGLSFEQAHAIANQIRDDLEGESSISTMRLRRRVIRRLRRSGLSEYITAYQQRSQPFSIEVERRNGQVEEFSHDVYRGSLEAIGLRPKESRQLARALVNHLLYRKVQRIRSAHIADLSYRLLRRSPAFGPAVARRWQVWRDFLASGRPLVFLIAGTAGCGKSTIAADLASRLDIVRIQSTDLLREVMRTLISAQQQPLLHQSSFSAWTVLEPAEVPELEGDELVRGYRQQAELLQGAIGAVIQRSQRESVSLVMEGVHIDITRLDELLVADDAVVIPIVLGVVKRSILKERILGRGVLAPQRRAEHYLKHFDDIWKLQSYILSEAEQAGILILINDSRDRVFREIMLTTIERLALDFPRRAEDQAD